MEKAFVFGDVRVPAVDCGGRLGVAFGTVDWFHGQPDGATADLFRVFKRKLIEEEDFFTFGPEGETFLTEFGYFMLMRHFDDDLSWKVYGHVVDSIGTEARGSIFKSLFGG